MPLSPGSRLGPSGQPLTNGLNEPQRS